MAKPSSPIINVTELHQVGIAVRDLEKSMEHYRNVFGIEPWETRDAGPSMISDMMYGGRPVKRPFRFRVALAMVGPMQLELIQPLEGELIYNDFLKEHGEGLHHLGHVKVQNLDDAVQALEKAGFPCTQRGHVGGGGFAYMDTVKALGFILELIELPKKVHAPGHH